MQIYIYDFGQISSDEWQAVEEVLLEHALKPLYGGALKVPEWAFEPERKQWDAQDFLKELAKEKLPALGLVKLDLFYDELNFIFGLASPTAKVGVVSFTRLDPEFWGEPPNNALYLERIKKEVLHEVGHILGLMHCSTPGCVMNFSNTIADVDRKTAKFCDFCERRIKTTFA